MSNCSRISAQALLQSVQETVQSLSELHDLRRRVREAEASFAKAKRLRHGLSDGVEKHFETKPVPLPTLVGDEKRSCQKSCPRDLRSASSSRRSRCGRAPCSSSTRRTATGRSARCTRLRYCSAAQARSRFFRIVGTICEWRRARAFAGCSTMRCRKTPVDRQQYYRLAHDLLAGANMTVVLQ